MKLLFASDSFKGSLSSKRTAELLTKAARGVFGACECIGVPIADGGEGTVDALIDALNGERASATVHDPLMNRIQAGCGIETVLDLIGFDDLLNGADLIVTGEGRADSQSVTSSWMWYTNTPTSPST